MENVLVISFIVVNLLAGVGLAIPLSKSFKKVDRGSSKGHHYFVSLILIYFLESVALAAGMATQVFTILLSIPWGYLIGRRILPGLSRHKILQSIITFSLYGCFPTFSFALLILLVAILSNNDIFSVAQGLKFGIPDFVPTPLNTIFGFCTALAGGTVVAKVTITMWMTFFQLKAVSIKN